MNRSARLKSVVRVSSGNFLEMYDFMVFGYYASAIGAAFFPSGNPFVSLMLALMTFGAGVRTGDWPHHDADLRRIDGQRC